MRKQFLEVGQVVATHGVVGEVRVKPLCDSADMLTEFDELFLDQKWQTCHLCFKCQGA